MDIIRVDQTEEGKEEKVWEKGKAEHNNEV